MQSIILFGNIRLGEAAAKAEAERREAERKALEESLLATEKDVKTQASVIKLTEADMLMLKEEQLRQELEKAGEAYDEFCTDTRMDPQTAPMTKDEFMKQYYPALYAQTHQPAQAPHSIADFTKEQAKERLSQAQGSMSDGEWRQLALRVQSPMTDKDWDGYKDGLHHTAQSASENLDALKNGYGKVTDGLAFQSWTQEGKDLLNKAGVPGKIFDAATLGAKETAIMTSDSQNKFSESGHLLAKTGLGMIFGGLGAAGGAAAGFVAGAVAGLPFGAGAIGTATVGAIGGGVTGGYYGGQLGEKTADWLFGVKDK